MNKLIIEVRTIQDDRVILTTCIVTQIEVFTLGIQSFKIDEFMTLHKTISEFNFTDKVEYRCSRWREYIVKLLEGAT